MLTLNDGRSELWQWDTGRKLTVDADCTQVHFSNKFFGRSVDVDVVDGVAEIPDVLLQVDKDLLVWAFVGTAENGYTKISKVFKVNKRNKPADYVFTPTEQTTLDEIMKRLDRIEEGQDPDAIKNAVDEYLANNPIQVEEKDPTVPDWAKEKTKPSYSKSEVGLGNVENVKQYSASNPPPYPVASVNGQTGKVQLGATDVGARPSNWMPTAQEVGALPDTYVPPNQTAAQVGADPAGTAAAVVSAHNTSTDSHGDLRLALKAINDRLTAFFDCDDTTLDELSEIVDSITSNKTLIDSITTSKVSVADIINNLTTNVANKPLSAAQGVALKGLIDAVSSSLSNYQPKGDYALRSEVPTKVSQLQNDEGYLKEHQDISGKLDADNLPEAIDEALAEAKESGAFDGRDGVSPTVSVAAITGGTRITITDKNGAKTVDVMNGTDGDDGNGIKSAVLNADYTLTLTFDDGTKYTTPSIRGEKGDKGDSVKGDDGISPTVAVSKSGKVATLTITDKNGTKTVTINDGADGTSVAVKSVSESTADGGSNVVTFSDGKTLNVKNGSKGDKGDPGTTPQKGIDFWTDADQESIVQDVIAALGTPVFGRVDADNNIILTGELADGTYTIKYEDAKGNVTEIGSLVNVKYVNQIPISTDANGSIYNSTGYKSDMRMNSSGVETAFDPRVGNTVFVTGFIPCKQGDVIRLKNCYMDTDYTKDYKGTATVGSSDIYGIRSGLYDASKAKVDVISWGQLYDGITSILSNYTVVDKRVTQFTIAKSGVSYVRLCLATDTTPADAIVTVNQEID